MAEAPKKAPRVEVKRRAYVAGYVHGLRVARKIVAAGGTSRQYLMAIDDRLRQPGKS